jgi:hypothetical protein
MEQRGIAEAGAAAGISGAVAAGTLVVVAGTIDWPVVVGLAAGGALAAAANYRARTGHAEGVAEEAPQVTADNYEEYTQPAAGDGGTEGMERDGPDAPETKDAPDGTDERD